MKASRSGASSPRSKQAPQHEPPSARQAGHQQTATHEHDTPNDGEIENGGSTTVETNAACMALLASLATADAQLRCGIATALGKLGDKQALVPLERHLSDQDIRVRRAVAAALLQLGHPKGQNLLDIAERKPAAAVLQEHRASTAPAKPRKSSGGGGIEGGTLKLLGGAILGVAIVAGGIWYWMNSAPSSGARKAKSAAAKKAKAKKATAPKAAKDE